MILRHDALDSGNRISAIGHVYGAYSGKARRCSIESEGGKSAPRKHKYASSNLEHGFPDF